MGGCLNINPPADAVQKKKSQTGAAASNYGGLSARRADEPGRTLGSLVLCSACRCALFIFHLFFIFFFWPPLHLREGVNAQGGFHRGLLISSLH